MARTLLYVWLLILFICIGGLFWYNDLSYAMPTPVPEHYSPPAMGERIVLPATVKYDSRPLFLHFFNPACPCSRFNLQHFTALVKNYGDQVNFQVVVMSRDKWSAEEIQDKIHMSIPVHFDSSIAALCGVYSTPQAVIINSNKTIFYRGNYNKSRYCTDKKTNYAETALISLLHHNPNPVSDSYALKAYGCQLPTCNNPNLKTYGR